MRSFEHLYYRSTFPTSWFWPLRMGVIGTAGHEGARLQDLYWTKQFCRISTLARGPKFQLAFTEDGIAGGFMQLQTVPFFTDTLLIRASEAEILKAQASPVLARNLQQLATQRRAAGLFIFSTEKTSPEWLESFIVELSHNKNVVEALKATATSGYFVYDNKLEKETKLSFFVRGLVLGLRGENLPNRIVGQQLANELEEQFLSGRAFFDHEQGDASDIAAITERIAQSASQVLGSIHQHVTDQLTRASAERGVPEALGPETEPGPDVPRYLQARILAEKDEAIPITLDYDKPYRLQVRIGMPETTWNSASIGLLTANLFANHPNQQETIRIVFTYRSGYRPGYPSGGEIQEQELRLAKYGNSGTVLFEFTTPTEGNVFTAELSAYHKNRLLQKVVLRISLGMVSANENTLRMDVIFCARKDLNNLETRQTFGTTLVVNLEEGKEGVVSGLVESKPIHLNIPPGLEGLLTGIKNDIEKAVLRMFAEGDQYPEDLHHPVNAALLRNLALKGNILFVNHLKRMELKGPLQIVTSRDEFIPLDFIYTFPPPDPKAGLCPNATAALMEGACSNCMDHKESPAPYVCPFGFLGLSQVIERHTTEQPTGAGASDYTIRAEPSEGREVLMILDNILYGLSTKVGAATPGLEAAIAASIGAYFPTRVETWKEWTKNTQAQNPDTQILLVHIEPDPDSGIDQIEIGTELLLQNFLDGSKIKPDPADRSPFMVVLGCKTVNLDNHGFDISNQLMNYGASIVLSNFTRIRGKHAGRTLISLVELLQEQPGRELLLGEVILTLKRRLLAKGIVAALALVALGDADWKISTTHV